MQLTSPTKRPSGGSSGRGPGRLSTRGGTLTVAALATLLAAAALLVFMRGYRDSLTGSKEVTVLVARSLVPKAPRAA